VPLVSFVTPKLPKATVDSAFVAYSDVASRENVA